MTRTIILNIDDRFKAGKTLLGVIDVLSEQSGVEVVSDTVRKAPDYRDRIEKLQKNKEADTNKEDNQGLNIWEQLGL